MSQQEVQKANLAEEDKAVSERIPLPTVLAQLVMLYLHTEPWQDSLDRVLETRVWKLFPASDWQRSLLRGMSVTPHYVEMFGDERRRGLTTAIAWRMAVYFLTGRVSTTLWILAPTDHFASHLVLFHSVFIQLGLEPVKYHVQSRLLFQDKRWPPTYCDIRVATPERWKAVIRQPSAFVFFDNTVGHSFHTPLEEFLDVWKPPLGDIPHGEQSNDAEGPLPNRRKAKVSPRP